MIGSIHTLEVETPDHINVDGLLYTPEYLGARGDRCRYKLRPDAYCDNTSMAGVEAATRELMTLYGCPRYDVRRVDYRYDSDQDYNHRAKLNYMLLRLLLVKYTALRRNAGITRTVDDAEIKSLFAKSSTLEMEYYNKSLQHHDNPECAARLELRSKRGQGMYLRPALIDLYDRLDALDALWPILTAQLTSELLSGWQSVQGTPVTMTSYVIMRRLQVADRAHLTALLAEMGAKCPKASAQKIAPYVQLIGRAEVQDYVRTLRTILADYIGMDSIPPVSFFAARSAKQ